MTPTKTRRRDRGCAQATGMSARGSRAAARTRLSTGSCAWAERVHTFYFVQKQLQIELELSASAASVTAAVRRAKFEGGLERIVVTMWFALFSEDLDMAEEGGARREVDMMETTRIRRQRRARRTRMTRMTRSGSKGEDAETPGAYRSVHLGGKAATTKQGVARGRSGR
jgi:hypothetical protein